MNFMSIEKYGSSGRAHSVSTIIVVLILLNIFWCDITMHKVIELFKRILKKKESKETQSVYSLQSFVPIFMSYSW